MKKPSPFLWKDFFALGIWLIISLVLTIIVFSSNVSSATPGVDIPTGVFGVHGLMIVITLAFSIIYAMVIFFKKKFLNKFLFTSVKDEYGIMIDFGDFNGSISEVVSVFEKTINGWSSVFGSQVVRDAVKDIKIFWVWFEPGPVKAPGRGENEKISGYTIFHTAKMIVGFKDSDQDIDKTALAHELGHVIQAKVTGVWNEKEHHERNKKMELP